MLSSAGSAVLLALAQPPRSLDLLGWFALVPVLLACHDRRGTQRLVLGLICGTSWAWILVGRWLWGATTEALAVGTPYSFLLTLFAVEVFGGLYVTAFLWLWEPLRRSSGYAAPLAGAASWVALELARSQLFGGYPWGLLGHSQWQRVALVQVADATGVYGLSFVIVAVNVAATEAVVALRRRCWHSGQTIAGATAFLLVAGTILYGTWRLADPMPATTVHFQAVHTRWAGKDSGSAEKLFRELIDLTSSSTPARARLVVWPENSLRFYVERSSRAVESIRRLLSRRDQYLLVGGPHAVADGSGWVFHNSAYLFDPRGNAVGRHDKAVLVPLAEEAIGALPSVERSFRRGRNASPLLMEERAIGALVCFEAIYPHIARQLVRQGAAVLVNLTNDQLIGAGASQQAAMAVFRAVENRVPLLRVSNLGPSLSVDPFGHVTPIPSAVSGSVVVTLPLGSGSTPYNRVGDLFALLCLVAFIGLGGRLLRSGANVPS